MSNGTAQPPASSQSAPEHAARYEALRAYAIERHVPASRDGLVVLLRQGLAAWMDAWSSLPTASPRPAKVERQSPSLLPDDASSEVVHVLAAMTLGHILEVHS